VSRKSIESRQARILIVPPSPVHGIFGSQKDAADDTWLSISAFCHRFVSDSVFVAGFAGSAGSTYLRRIRMFVLPNPQVLLEKAACERPDSYDLELQ
jgi:hypothetical protein